MSGGHTGTLLEGSTTVLSQCSKQHWHPPFDEDVKVKLRSASVYSDRGTNSASAIGTSNREVFAEVPMEKLPTSAPSSESPGKNVAE